MSSFPELISVGRVSSLSPPTTHASSFLSPTESLPSRNPFFFSNFPRARSFPPRAKRSALGKHSFDPPDSPQAPHPFPSFFSGIPSPIGGIFKCPISPSSPFLELRLFSPPFLPQIPLPISTDDSSTVHWVLPFGISPAHHV